MPGHRFTKIFLSHSYSDNSTIKKRLIKDLIALKGVKIWRAEEQLSVGKYIGQEIANAIAESDYFIQIASFGNTPWTNAELELAMANQIVTQNLKVITAITNDDRNEGILLGQGRRGVVINFSKNYEGAFQALYNTTKVNSSDSLIKFDLDIIVEAEPIIVITNRINEKLIDYYSKHSNELKHIDRRLFEEMVAELFVGFGYSVELTKQTRDGGRDVVAIKNDETEIKYLIECKRPDEGNIIGVKPVRELLGVKYDEKATKAILATTSYFSHDALQYFERNKWELESKDFDGLIDWIDLYKKRKGLR